MADDDDKNGRKLNSDRGSRTPHWRETCIGIWSRSTKDHHVNDGEYDKICNGISVIRIHGKVTLKIVSIHSQYFLQSLVSLPCCFQKQTSPINSFYLYE